MYYTSRKKGSCNASSAVSLFLGSIHNNPLHRSRIPLPKIEIMVMVMDVEIEIDVMIGIDKGVEIKCDNNM